ncbi:unnamed protein product [Acanthosepion pharaonis]|uniref:Uncharacterized protein n=1 Tax=Acanthosepion pharaonis TaxID=158019 RepID=A0A812AJR2_ACAPH|nr:unnamed protein product [Sepia pharaonis]
MSLLSIVESSCGRLSSALISATCFSSLFTQYYPYFILSLHLGHVFFLIILCNFILCPLLSFPLNYCTARFTLPADVFLADFCTARFSSPIFPRVCPFLPRLILSFSPGFCTARFTSSVDVFLTNFCTARFSSLDCVLFPRFLYRPFHLAC